MIACLIISRSDVCREHDTNRCLCCIFSIIWSPCSIRVVEVANLCRCQSLISNTAVEGNGVLVFIECQRCYSRLDCLHLWHSRIGVVSTVTLNHCRHAVVGIRQDILIGGISSLVGIQVDSIVGIVAFGGYRIFRLVVGVLTLDDKFGVVGSAVVGQCIEGIARNSGTSGSDWFNRKCATTYIRSQMLLNSSSRSREVVGRSNSKIHFITISICNFFLTCEVSCNIITSISNLAESIGVLVVRSVPGVLQVGSIRNIKQEHLGELKLGIRMQRLGKVGSERSQCYLGHHTDDSDIGLKGGSVGSYLSLTPHGQCIIVNFSSISSMGDSLGC